MIKPSARLKVHFTWRRRVLVDRFRIVYGNRLWSATNSYTANNLNQYTSILRAFAPPREITHDADGNMLSDGNLTFTYNAANRLKTASSNGVILIANEYDYRNRRIKKTTPTLATTFVYDGWNLIHETVSTINGSVTNTTEIQYFWGADLSETLQGAGGVGGLLAVSCNNNFYFPAYDNNGNVTKYIDENGNVVAAYEYDDFGRTISQSGPMASVFRHRFSTKYFDSEAGLYYYGYRFYSPSLMRWMNRDPIEEDGGLNLYGFCGNDVMSTIDSFGKEVVVINHLGDDPPSGGWTHQDAAAETVFPLQTYTVDERCESTGRIRFSVKIIPSVLVVHVHQRVYNSYTTSANPSLLMAVARLKEKDHVSIARRLDKAFYLFKYQVERIDALPAEARRQKVMFEESLSRTVRLLLEENRMLDRKGGPHVL